MPTYMRYLDGVLTSWEKTDHHRGNVRDGREFSSLLANMLNITPLYHVTESMAAVSRHAAEKLEEDQLWLPDNWPSLEGLIFFEKPLLLVDIWNRPVSIGAMLWYSTLNPTTKRPGVSTVLFADADDERDYYNRALDVDRPGWRSDIGRFQVFESSWMPYGVTVGTWETDYAVDTVQDYQRSNRVPTKLDPDSAPPVPFGTPITTNLGRICYAIFELMGQKIGHTEEYTDRRLARRNRNKKRPPAVVTVIQLRRREQYGYHEECTGTWLTYQSITRGHWRWQPYGPNRSQVKRIYIHPYVRGPENAPFFQPKRVATLAR